MLKFYGENQVLLLSLHLTKRIFLYYYPVETFTAKHHVTTNASPHVINHFLHREDYAIDDYNTIQEMTSLQEVIDGKDVTDWLDSKEVEAALHALT